MGAVRILSGSPSGVVLRVARQMAKAVTKGKSRGGRQVLDGFLITASGRAGSGVARVLELPANLLRGVGSKPGAIGAFWAPSYLYPLSPLRTAVASGTMRRDEAGEPLPAFSSEATGSAVRTPAGSGRVAIGDLPAWDAHREVGPGVGRVLASRAGVLAPALLQLDPDDPGVVSLLVARANHATLPAGWRADGQITGDAVPPLAAGRPGVSGTPLARGIDALGAVEVEIAPYTAGLTIERAGPAAEWAAGDGVAVVQSRHALTFSTAPYTSALTVVRYRVDAVDNPVPTEDLFAGAVVWSTTLRAEDMPGVGPATLPAKPLPPPFVEFGGSLYVDGGYQFSPEMADMMVAAPSARAWYAEEPPSMVLGDGYPELRGVHRFRDASDLSWVATGADGSALFLVEVESLAYADDVPATGWRVSAGDTDVIETAPFMLQVRPHLEYRTYAVQLAADGTATATLMGQFSCAWNDTADTARRMYQPVLATRTADGRPAVVCAVWERPHPIRPATTTTLPNGGGTVVADRPARKGAFTLPAPTVGSVSLVVVQENGVETPVALPAGRSPHLGSYQMEKWPSTRYPELPSARSGFGVFSGEFGSFWSVAQARDGGGAMEPACEVATGVIVVAGMADAEWGNERWYVRLYAVEVATGSVLATMNTGLLVDCVAAPRLSCVLPFTVGSGGIVDYGVIGITTTKRTYPLDDSGVYDRVFLVHGFDTVTWLAETENFDAGSAWFAPSMG